MLPLPLLLDAPPSDGYALLELGVDGRDLGPAEQRLASSLRLFAITRDPLAWLPDRGASWATVNADGDQIELAAYLKIDRPGDEMAARIASLAAIVLARAAALESLLVAGGYPALAAEGAVPRLLDGTAAPVELGAPVVMLRGSGWEPIGLGAIQDLVQDAFGPVDLDRSQIALGPARRHHEPCPACRGERFGFPADLHDAAGRMCDEHRAAAARTSAERIARARASNPAGWAAMGKASARVNGIPEPGGLPLPRRVARAVGRNDPCPCGSGRKHKHCCGADHGPPPRPGPDASRRSLPARPSLSSAERRRSKPQSRHPNKMFRTRSSHDQHGLKTRATKNQSTA